MPLVGSSRSSTSARWCSSRASATFCWLPPESVRAACHGRARLDRERLHPGAGLVALRAAPQPAARRAGAVAGAGDVVGEGHRRAPGLRPCDPRSGSRGRRRDASPATPCARDAVRARGRRPLSAGSRPISARIVSVRPEPTRPATPRISPRRSRNAARRTAGGDATSTTSTSDVLLRLRGALREQRVDRASDHVRDERLVGDVGERAGRDAAAVAEHGEPIGDLAHLLEEVADVDDGHAARLEPPDQREQPRHVLARQAAGRLVHQHDRRPAPPSRGRISTTCRAAMGSVPTTAIGRQLGVREALEQAGRLAAHRGAIEPAAAGRLEPHQDVLGHRQVRAERELLVDQRDAGVARGQRRRRRVGRAVRRASSRRPAPARPRSR